MLLFDRLSLPLMCAPMSFASSPQLARACCDAGILGGWQGGTVTNLEDFRDYLDVLAKAGDGPPIVNIPARVHSLDDGAARLDLLAAAQAPLVLSSVGDPSKLVARVHDWGGRIVQDVTTMRHAEKALAAGVDGLMLTCAGAGGHAGGHTPFAFVPAVRRIWKGLLIVAGGIADATGMAAGFMLGADLVCMGTRFIATPESGVVEAHREMIAATGVDGIMTSAAMNGIPASWIRDSVEANGLDPATLPNHRIPMPEGVRPWRDIFSAGQSVGLIDDVRPVADIVAGLEQDFARIVPESGWRRRLAEIEADWQQAA